MKNILKIVVMLLIVSSPNTFAANSWYWGAVTQVQTYQPDGSFQIYINNTSITSVCSAARVNFEVVDMGAERTRAAMSMAMTALVSGKEFGVVVDLPTSGQICKASATASQGAGIR